MSQIIRYFPISFSISRTRNINTFGVKLNRSYYLMNPLSVFPLMRFGVNKSSLNRVIVFSNKHSHNTESNIVLTNQEETSNKNISSFFSLNQKTKLTNRELNQNLIKILRLTVLQKQKNEFLLKEKSKSVLSISKNEASESVNVEQSQILNFNAKKTDTFLEKNKLGVTNTIKRKVTRRKVNQFEMNYRKYFFLQTIINKSNQPSRLQDLSDFNKSKQKQITTLVAKKYLTFYYNVNEKNFSENSLKSVMFNSNRHFLKPAMHLKENSKLAIANLDSNLTLPTIKQKSFLSYWLLPIVGFYSILAASKPLNNVNEYINQKQSNRELDSTNVTIHPVFNNNFINNNLHDHLRFLHNELPALNQIAFKNDSLSYLNSEKNKSVRSLQKKLNIEMDQLAISYLNNLLTPEFKNLIDFTSTLNTNKIESNYSIQSNVFVNQYKALKSHGLIYWYQLPMIETSKPDFSLQTSFLAYSDSILNFGNLTQPLNGVANNQVLGYQLNTSKKRNARLNLFSWNILNTVNTKLDILHSSKQKALLLNSQILNFKQLPTNMNIQNSSEQGKLKKNLVNLKLGKASLFYPFKTISFVTIKPNLKNNECSFFKNTQALGQKNIILVSNIDSSNFLKSLPSINAQLNNTNCKEQISFSSTQIGLNLNVAKSSVQQFKQISLFLDNLIATYNWNITKSVTPNLVLNENIKKETNASLQSMDLSSRKFISNNVFKTQFKEKQLLSKEHILDLLNQELKNRKEQAFSSPSTDASDKLFSTIALEKKFLNLSNINNVQNLKTAMANKKTTRAFNYELDSVFNYLSLHSLNPSAVNPNWTSVQNLNTSQSNLALTSQNFTFIKIKTPLVTTHPRLFRFDNNFNIKDLVFNTNSISTKVNNLLINKPDKNNNMVYVNVDTSIGFSTKEKSTLEQEIQTNKTSFKSWILLKTNLFKNYLKYIHYKLNGFYKINSYNSKLILKNALIIKADSQNPYSKGYNSFNSLKKETVKTIGKSKLALSFQKQAKIVLSEQAYSDLSKVNPLELNYTNSLPIVLKHKKIFKLANPVLNERLGSNNELEQNFLNSKKDLQKKHRAKKQRLESRRQKKRKRFYPRPVWLRLRLAFDLNTIKTAPNKFINSSNKNKFVPLQYSTKNTEKVEQTCSTQFKTNWGNQKSTLNSYLTSLSNINKNDYLSDSSSTKLGFIPNIKTFIGKSKLALSLQSKQKVSIDNLSLDSISPYKKKTNNYQYNNIVFNLWLSSKKIKLFNNQILIKKNEEKATNLNTSNSSKLNCYTNKLKHNLSNKKQNLSKLSDNTLTKSLYQDLSQYAYKEKLFLTRKALVEFKNINGKQYTIFENKSNTNPPKKTNEDNIVRDFWIWLYNLTTRNQWTNTFLAKTGITNLSVPIQMTSKSPNNLSSSLELETPTADLEELKQNSKKQNGYFSSLTLKQANNKFINTDIFNLQQKARLLFSSNKRFSQAAFQQANADNLNRINWALNKTNLWSSTTKRLTLWSSQKLRNQSKNNKTKFIEKQIQKKMNSAFSNLSLKSFLTKANNNYYKFNITQKMHQKEQKLAYLNGINNLNHTGVLNNANFAELKNKKPIQLKQINNSFDLGFISKPTVDLTWWNGINVNKAQLQNTLINSYDLNNLTELTNTFYLNTLKDKNLTSSFHQLIDQYKINIESNGAFLDFSSRAGQSQLALTSHKSKVTEGQIAQTLLSNNYNISLLALLFHFCALISLISISQIRCFLKFHLILVHKLSNFYLQVIYKNLGITVKMLANLNQKNKLSSISRTRNINTFGVKFFNGLFTTESELTKNSSIVIPPTSSLFIAEKLPSFSSNSIKFNNKNKRSIKNKKVVKRSTTSFDLTNLSKFKYMQTASNYQKTFDFDFENQSSLNAFKASTKNIIFWNWSKNLSQTNNYYLRYLAERFTLIKAFKKETNLSNVNVNTNIEDVKNKVSKLNLQLEQSVTKTFNSLEYIGAVKKNNNLLLLNSFIKKCLIFANLVQSLDKSTTSQKTKTNKNNTQLNKNLKSQELAILSLTYQLGLTEFTKQTVTTIKKGTLETTYKVVDSFEYGLKLIYSFFEKPAEFTMDWIAYAFLVEWSSDLLAFTPEKTEKQSWLAFSKFLRGSRTVSLLQNQIYGTGSLTPNSSLVFTPNLLNLPINLTLGQLLYKRLLYLNDTFLEILNRPDTDLMNRQKKGTLFWDIWSDVLIKAADKYNINVPSLSNIKEEQNTLIDKVLADNAIFEPKRQLTKGKVLKDFNNPISKLKQKLESSSLRFPFEKEKTNTFIQTNERNLSKSSILPVRVTNMGNHVITGMNNFTQNENVLNYSTIIKSTQNVNQFVTYQSKETDLFLDYHPPKSFKHISAIRYYNMVQQPIGALVCQIYSGLLTKQIAKNVLVIGSTLSSTSDTNLERSQKTLLIQALAGETEIKIITDNASRYAIVNRGFAVGIKLLKDVFEAISLNTPCLFLLEDIHLIGERRPLLISDHGDAVGDELSKSTETTFGAQRNGEAVHEKNQVLYQLSRHGIAHYKKPFKGDFSLSIPTNHFGFDLFLKSRYANYSSTPTNPLSYGINLIELEKTGSTGNSSNTESNSSNLSLKLLSKRSEFNFGTNQKTALATSLQMVDTANQLLSPPSTSPFTVLLLKEQKKLKPKRIVKELPWIGLPSEQLALLPRVSYSVRAKVAALADLGFSNMSAKLDMITDLLVIIDSVRGNRGFVVFATTHLPHILDPALRRPGRLDETISIPTLSNIWTRWEFTKAADPILINERAIKMNFTTTNNIIGYSGTFDYLDFMNLDFIPNITGNNNFFNTIVTRFNLVSQRNQHMNLQYNGMAINTKQSISNLSQTTHLISKKLETSYQLPKTVQNSSHIAKAELSMLLKKRYNKYLNQINQIAYYQMGKKFITNQNTFALSSFSPIYNNLTTYSSNITLTDTSDYLTNQIQYNSLYSSPTVIKKTLIGLLSGKLSQLFALQTKPVILNTSNTQLYSESGLTNFPILSPLRIQNTNQIQSIVKNILTLYGIDETWRAATTLALSFIQKRYLYNKNLIVPKLLNFQDYSTLEEPPSPPTSNILIPAKRYENSKKALKENIERKVTTSIQDKLEAHNKQSYIKTIYNIKQSSNLQTFVNPNLNSLLALDSYTQPLTQPSSITWHYQNKLLKRHRNYLNNQWWNGQLTEHNAETLFLSDIDWRYTFIDNLNNPNLNQSNLIFFNKLKGSTDLLNLGQSETKKTQTRFQDIVIDFPDADQHYNPKHRRWMVTSGDWNSWFNIDKKLQTAIFEHLIFECMIKTYTILDQNRELLDYSASKYMKKGLIKEFNTNVIFKKFGLENKH